jgi:hypothetical protein
VFGGSIRTPNPTPASTYNPWHANRSFIRQITESKTVTVIQQASQHNAGVRRITKSQTVVLSYRIQWTFEFKIPLISMQTLYYTWALRIFHWRRVGGGDPKVTRNLSDFKNYVIKSCRKYSWRRKCTAARLLGLWVWILPGAWMFVVSVVCCQLEVSATSLSLVQMSPTDCGASLIYKPHEWWAIPNQLWLSLK